MSVQVKDGEEIVVAAGRSKRYPSGSAGRVETSTVTSSLICRSESALAGI
jgi:hypothetical protein